MEKIIVVQPLLDYFEKLISLSDVEKQLVTELFKSRLYRKKQYILQENEICNKGSFVINGCLRMYKVDDNGNIHIIQFASENWWIMDFGSFHSRTPSNLSIDALEDTHVLQISYENLLSLYAQAPKFERIFRILVENSMLSLQRRLLQNISSTAEEKYLSFIETYPHLIKRLPQTQIASFLGITPEFLSRLRDRQMKSKLKSKS